MTQFCPFKFDSFQLTSIQSNFLYTPIFFLEMKLNECMLALEFASVNQYGITEMQNRI